jgi:MFS family permease
MGDRQLMRCAGSIIGPAIGGALANPLHRSPKDDTKRNDVFWVFPFALPNLICAVLFLISAVLAFLFLRETLSVRKNQTDYGVELGKKLKAWLRKTLALPWHMKSDKQQGEGEQDPLLANGAANHHHDHDEILADNMGATSLAEAGSSDSGGTDTKDKPAVKILNSQTIICLLVYGLVPIQFFSFDQMVSWLLAYPRSGPDVGETDLPFKFSRGFGMTS